MPGGDYVVRFEDLRMSDLARVGGKNASLGEMIAHLAARGIRVPGGFATTAAGFREFLQGAGLAKRIEARLAALDADDVEMIVGRALADLTSAVERRHSVRVRVTPEAARFAAQQAAQAAPGARGAKRTVERLIHGPLGALVLTGKLTRHTSWVAVYDEGGIYLLPEG